MDDLVQLVGRAGDGDLDAFGCIVRRFQDMAYGYAYSVLGDFHLAEDAAQEAFVEAYQQLPGLREPKAFPGWLRRIVFKHCDRLTRKKHVATVPLDEAAQVTSGEPTPDQAAQACDLTRRVLEVIRELPDNERVATTLYYINGYSQKEVADFLDVPVSTVKSRLHTSRNRLRERMLAMVDTTLKSFPLPERFADVVVQLNTVISRINPLAAKMRALSPDAMQAKTCELRERLQRGESRDEVRDEAFALVREASRRAHNQPHYDIQLVAAMILDEGWIAEEATGEGKTLTCLPAAYMAVLDGMHVHMMTVNDYLARRDAEFARAVFSQLGVTVGCLTTEARDGADDLPVKRRRAYACGVVYGCVSDFGFDHLRGQTGEEAIQGPLDFAIMDEADSMMIDEALTPLKISRLLPLSEDRYRRADTAAQALTERSGCGAELYGVDPKHQYDVVLTDEGSAAASAWFDEHCRNQEIGPEEWCRSVRQALRARLLYQKDREYVVEEGEVHLLDEATGRPQRGRRYSEGLHQALEVKEGVELKPESEVLATIRFQQYFELYTKLAGVTGTAATQVKLFREQYGMDVGVVPTRRPAHRIDYGDRVYADEQARCTAVAAEVVHHSRELGRPVLVGTRTIEESERLSALLVERYGFAHEVLNARPTNAAREASIVSQAGQQHPAEDSGGKPVGAVTIATNMAGRGTDIRLAEGCIDSACRVPSDDVLCRLGVDADPLLSTGSVKCCLCCPEYDAESECAHCFKTRVESGFPARGRVRCREQVPCGLHVVGVGRQNRRLDDQLRARAGRQGDPGSSRFFLCRSDEIVGTAAEALGVTGFDGLTGDAFLEGEDVSESIRCAQETLEERRYAIHRAVIDAARG